MVKKICINLLDEDFEALKLASGNSKNYGGRAGSFVSRSLYEQGYTAKAKANKIYMAKLLKKF